ncbi:MAG: PhzF family phenazine biosynthesis protein [Armatimonadetes bacterium]|nr:PhzF family phenazine biosynthesis protein [Armatimonadota bacterium]
MSVRLHVVDAFTSQPFSGNPAGVCLLPVERGAEWMQLVARELNLSETAFLSPVGQGYRLRWFTPQTEIDLCGHATLASAHILWQTGVLSAEAPAVFATRSGELTCRRDGAWIAMDFPAITVSETPAPEALFAGLGVEPAWVGRSDCRWLVEVADASTVRHLRPTFARLAQVPSGSVIVTAVSDEPDSDFVSRYFAPGMGIDEDPVTGSAHCALAPYWQARLGRVELVGRQLSARGGTVRCAAHGDRVLLGGQAITVSQVEMLV